MMTSSNGNISALLAICAQRQQYAKFLLKVWASRYSIVTYCNYESSWWVHYWTYIEPELRARQILMEQSKENAEIGRIILPYR